MREFDYIEGSRIGQLAPDGSGRHLSLWGCKESRMSFDELINYVSQKNKYSCFMRRILPGRIDIFVW